MRFEERRRRNGPVFKSHRKAHDQILDNEGWFGDGAPVLGKQFTAARAKVRKAAIVNLLFRTAKLQCKQGNVEVCYQLENLAENLDHCRPRRRCGSVPCPECHRAFQKAKVSAEKVTIRQLKADREGKLLVMANVIPLQIAYTPEQLSGLNVRNLNRRLKDWLTRAGFKRVMLGSIDFSWEAERGIYQPHWHIALWTDNRAKLTRRLKRFFPSRKRGDRPVVVSKAYDLGFLRYKNKAIKLPALLRNNRRGLPYLLLALDRVEPLELMVLSGVRISAQQGRLQFQKIQRR